MEDLHVLSEMERKQGGNNKKSLISSPFGIGQLLTFGNATVVGISSGRCMKTLTSPRWQGEFILFGIKQHGLDNG